MKTPCRRQLAEFVDIASGQINPTERPYAQMLHVGGDNIESGTGRLLGMRTPEDLNLISGKYLFDEHDVLYSKIRPNLNKVATPCFSGVCSADIYPVRPRPGVMDRQFLAHLLRTNDFLAYAINHSSRTNIPKVNRSALLAYEAPVPRFSEQKRIAAILDQADTIRRKRRTVCDIHDELPASAFVEFFGHPACYDGKWRICQLGDFIAFMTSGSRGWAEHYVPQGRRFIRSMDVQMNHIASSDAVYVDPPKGTEADRTRTRPGDVLLTITGSKVGRVAPVPEDFGEAHVSQHVAIIRVRERLRPRYCSMYLSLPDGGQRQIARAQYGQIKPGLNLNNIRHFRIPCPPLELQDRFLEVWDKSDRLGRSIVAAADESDALFNSLAQRAFRGEL